MKAKCLQSNEQWSVLQNKYLGKLIRSLKRGKLNFNWQRCRRDVFNVEIVYPENNKS